MKKKQYNWKGNLSFKDEIDMLNEDLMYNAVQLNDLIEKFDYGELEDKDLVQEAREIIVNLDLIHKQIGKTLKFRR